jgi:hypothetical protein
MLGDYGCYAAAVKKRFGMTPRMQDRLAAAAQLADRLHGRPIQAIDVDDGRPDVPCFIMPPRHQDRDQMSGGCDRLAPLDRTRFSAARGHAGLRHGAAVYRHVRRTSNRIRGGTEGWANGRHRASQVRPLAQIDCIAFELSR